MKKLIKDKSEKYCKKCKPIYKKETRKTQIVSICIFFVIIIVGFSFLFLPYKTKIDNVIEPMVGVVYNEISETYQNDEIVINLASLCSNFERDEDKLTCVNQFVKNFFHYDSEIKGIKPIRYPEELINYGGCCRDYSVFYKSVLDLMGFETEFVFEPNHVYLMIYTDEGDYVLDQQALWEFDAHPRKEEITYKILPAKELEIN